MGVGEINSKVLIEMKYDVSDARKSLRFLRDDEKKTSELRIQLAEMENKRIDGQIKNIGRISTGLQMARAAGIDLGGEIQKLTGIPLGGQGTALGFMFGGPWGAAIGTLGEMLGGTLADALGQTTRDAIKADQAYINLMATMKEEEKEVAEAAAAFKKLAEAARAADPAIGGMQRALDEHTGKWQKARDAIVSYSMALSDVQNDRRAAITGQSYSGGSYKDAAGTFISRQERELERSLRDAKTTLEGTTSAFGSVAADAKIKADRLKDSLADLKAAKAAGALSAKDYADGLKALGFEAKEADKQLTEMVRARFHAAKYLDTEAKAYERYAAALAKAREQEDLIESIGKGGKSTLPQRQGGRAGAVAEEISAGLSKGSNEEEMARAQKNAEIAGQAYDRNQEKVRSLANANLEAATSNEILGSSYAALGQVAGSVYGALIDGTDDLGATVKRASANAIKALGTEFLVKGVGQIAEGAAATASVWGAWKAPGHYAAGSMFLKAAGVAGIAAAALGGFGGGGAPGGGARPSAPSYNGPSGGGSSERSAPVIVVGSPFAYDSPRNQQKNAKRLTGLALGTNSVIYG